MVELVISIPVTGDTDLIGRCLASIVEHTKCSYRIVVVDNQADPAVIERITADHPEISVIHNQRPMCYAHNQNRVIAATQSPYLLLLNDDTEMVGDAVDRLLQFLKERGRQERIAGVSPRFLNPDGSLQRSTFCLPTSLTATISYLGLRKLIPYSRLTTRLSRMMLGGERTSRFWEHDRTREVDNVYGAAVLMRRQAIEEVGLMDEIAQAYGEEIEWHLRFRKQGYTFYYFNDASVIHHGEVTNDRSRRPMVICHEAAGLLNLFAKHYPPRQLQYLRLLLILTSAAKIAIHSVAGVLDFKRWRFVRPHWRIIGLACRSRYQQN